MRGSLSEKELRMEHPVPVLLSGFDRVVDSAAAFAALNVLVGDHARNLQKETDLPERIQRPLPVLILMPLHEYY